MQKERGRSAVVLSSAVGSSGEQQTKRELAAQRQDTDQSLRTYRNGLQALVSDTDFDRAIRASIERLEQQLSGLGGQNTGQIKGQQQQIEQVAAATEEMSATSEEISQNTQQVADASNSAMEKRRAGEQASEMEKTFADILTDVNSISDMATQIATVSEEPVAVTRELAGSMESVSGAAILTLTGSQEISQMTQEQARLARRLQDLANEFKMAG